MKSTPCQVGPGQVGVWVESGTGWGRIGVDSVSSRVGSGQVWVEWGTGRGRIGVDSVSSRVGSGQGLDGVGDGPGSCLGASH